MFSIWEVENERVMLMTQQRHVLIVVPGKNNPEFYSCRGDQRNKLCKLLPSLTDHLQLK